jgi:hypothetical protein
MAIYRKKVKEMVKPVLLGALVLLSAASCATAQPATTSQLTAEPERAGTAAIKPGELGILTYQYAVRDTPQGFITTFRPVQVGVLPTQFGDEVKRFLEKMGQVLQQVPTGMGPYQLDEVELHAEVAVHGSLILAGATGTGGITFKLKRQSGAPTGAK